MDLIGIDVKEVFDLNTLNVDSKVLGEGAFGCVLKSANGKYAIKVQEITARDKCQYESSLQHKLSEVVLDAAVASVYFYDANITQIPIHWRNALSQGCKKAPMWGQKNWTGLFCITVMDFLPGNPPAHLHPYNFPLFCFSLLYTVSVGYEKIKFQHIDIKTGNIIMVPESRESVTYYACNISSAFTFKHATLIPKMVDFGLSTTIDIPSSIDVLGNKGSTLMITPFEVAVGRILSRNPSVKTFMHSDGPKRYHWSYDLFSIGVTILNATLSQSDQDTIGFRMINDAAPYMMGLLQKYGLNTQSEEALHPGMVIMYMYNLCIIQELIGNGRYPNLNDPGLASFYPRGTVGYDLLFAPDNRTIIDYLVAKNTLLYANDIQRFKQTYGESAIGLVASLLRWNPEKRGGGRGQVLNDAYFRYFRSQRDCGPQPHGGQPQASAVNTFIFVVGPSPKGRVAYLKLEPQSKQYYLFTGCPDLHPFLEGGCNTEGLKRRPTIEIKTKTETNRLVLYDIQNKRIMSNQLYVIDLAILIQVALATKSGSVAKNGPVTISMQVLSAVRNFKKQGIL